MIIYLEITGTLKKKRQQENISKEELKENIQSNTRV
jgi:hypothetical protein